MICILVPFILVLLIEILKFSKTQDLPTEPLSHSTYLNFGRRLLLLMRAAKSLTCYLRLNFIVQPTMSEAPSWLTEENISTATKAAKNPAAQAAAKKVVQNPAAQSAAKAQIAKEAPGWTTDDVSHDIEKGRKPEKAAKATTPPPSSPSSPKPVMDTDMSDMDPEVLKEMQRYHLGLRVLYMGAAVFLSLAAALALQSQTDLGLIFFCFYVFLFSALLCCFECALTVSVNHLHLLLSYI